MTADPNCFCELAPLYALGLLDEAERQWVEQQIELCPDLAEELNHYQAAVTAIPYGAPLEPMAPDLKERLFDRLNLTAPSPTPAPIEETVASYLAVRSQDLRWQQHPVRGVRVAILHQDPIKRELVGLFRAEAGIHYPFHRHAAVEEIYMLEGDLIAGEEVYGPGDYLRSEPGSGHALSSAEGCMFFFRTSMDDEYPDFSQTSGAS